MTMDSVLFNHFTCRVKGRRRRSPRSVLLMLSYRLSIICYILAIIKYNLFILYSMHVALKRKPAITHPSCHLVPGKNKANNILFTKKLISSLIICNLLLFVLPLLLSGDVQPNPGPDSFTESVSLANSNSLASVGNINILHLNIQSVLPKLDILETEMQNYDILVFTETWLSPQINNDDILITNFNRPYRKDSLGRLGSGVAIYTRVGISSVERTDLLYNDLEAVCIEITLQSHKILLCGYYRPPNSVNNYWDLIEQSLDNLTTIPISDVIILGDFNCDMLGTTSANRINQPASSYNLHQLIKEPIHYTEHSSPLIDIILVSKPKNILYSDVISPCIPDLIRYHCPTVCILKYIKPTKRCFKRNIWVYEKGDYNKYRQLLTEVNWNRILFKEDLNDIVNEFTDTIMKAAKSSIPNKTVLIRPNEPNWINSSIKRHIRQRKRLYKIAKRINNEQIWIKFRLKQ